MGDSIQDAYVDAKFTAEISNRMQVPDRILMSGSQSPSITNGDGESKFNEMGMRRRDPRLDMQVPDRILVAGGNSHIASKSTPRELQLENAIMPPTPEHVRVTTPPRSIRLDEHSYPMATDDESSSTYGADDKIRGRKSSNATTADISESNLKHDSSSLALLNDPRENLSPSEEMQLLRRQMAKMNHRLMAVELENQQQQQREMILTVLASAYLLSKVFFWLNRSL